MLPSTILRRRSVNRCSKRCRPAYVQTSRRTNSARQRLMRRGLALIVAYLLVCSWLWAGLPVPTVHYLTVSAFASLGYTQEDVDLAFAFASDILRRHGGP